MRDFVCVLSFGTKPRPSLREVARGTLVDLNSDTRPATIVAGHVDIVVSDALTELRALPARTPWTDFLIAFDFVRRANQPRQRCQPMLRRIFEGVSPLI